MCPIITIRGRKTFLELRAGFLWVTLFVLVPTVVLPAGTTSSVSTMDVTKLIQKPLKILKSSANPLDTRKTAAGLLMDLGVSGAREPLLKILSDPSDRQARLAVVEAIADQDEPSSEFMQPLIEILLTGEAELQTAASNALGRYRDETLTDRLIGLAADAKRPVGQRLATIETLGKIRSKTTISALIKLMEANISGQSKRNEIETACEKSLKELTRVDLGTNIKAWKNWWEKNKNKSVVQWLESQLDVVTNENRDLRKRMEQTDQALIQTAAKLFRLSSPNEADRVKVIQEYLAGPLPAQRRAGLELLTAFISPKQKIPDALHPAIRDLIDDPDPEVRRACAKVLGDSNDTQAIGQILRQLDAETDPAVKQALLVAIGQLGDKDILNNLIGYLNSPIDQVSVGAVRAIAKIFQNQKSGVSSQRDHIAQALLKRYKQSGDDQIQLKQEILITMGMISDYRFRQLFEQELGNANADIRLYAARGMARLGDEKIADLLIEQLKDSEPAVRAELASGIASLTSDPHAVEILLTRTNPNFEKDNQVRQSNWIAVLTMIKHWSVEEQLRWANKLTLQSDMLSQEQMTALVETLGAQIMEQSNAWPPDQRFGIMINFGKFLLKTGQPEDSVKYFRQAITAAKQLSLAKPLESADQLLSELFQTPASDTVISQYLSSLVGLLEQDQLETIVVHFIHWAEHPANTRTAAKICKRLSKDFLNGVSENSKDKLVSFSRTNVSEPTTKRALSSK
ncbi:MAG: HEAT repeat domain-containing protein [Phycisphaerae bacterium]